MNDESSKELPISISIIDYIGQIDSGVGILINLVIEDTSYELAYWYNREGYVKIVPEQRLLDVLEVTDIYQYDKINELVQTIYDCLPDPNAILNEFIKEE